MHLHETGGKTEQLMEIALQVYICEPKSKYLNDLANNNLTVY